LAGTPPAGRNFDAILIGDYEVGALQYVAKVHGGFMPNVRAAVFKRFHGLETKTSRRSITWNGRPRITCDIRCSRDSAKNRLLEAGAAVRLALRLQTASLAGTLNQRSKL
jgi:ATP-dependent DNA ligase